ncbi:MAG: EAL domain-containing protein [Roseateles sp.]
MRAALAELAGALREPFCIENRRLTVSYSAGWVVAPPQTVPLDMLAMADVALQQACRDARTMLDRGARPAAHLVAINVSRLQLQDEGFARLVSETLKANGLAPQLICLELTESLAMDLSMIKASFDALRRTGVSLYLDDFGTGHSSLAELEGLPVTGLKRRRRRITWRRLARARASSLSDHSRPAMTPRCVGPSAHSQPSSTASRADSAVAGPSSSRDHEGTPCSLRMSFCMNALVSLTPLSCPKGPESKQTLARSRCGGARDATP